MRVRFDDSLKTVLAADTSTAFGAQSAFRQLVDLVARGRAPADPEVLDRVRELRGEVPDAIRAASARAAALTHPPAGLVAMFVEDDVAISAPILRAATLADADWQAILPALGPTGRSVLRHRRDLSPAVIRALEAFGGVDFALTHEGSLEAETVSIATVPAEPVAVQAAPAPTFDIPNLVARIAAYQDRRLQQAPDAADEQAPQAFTFGTDARGTIDRVAGINRGSLIGLSIAGQRAGGVDVDGVAIGAFRQRAHIRDARLSIENASEAGGEWRISAAPAFDDATGRFVGYQGTARRPRSDESAALHRDVSGSEAMRRLVHELRTPINAIVGFSELIESQLMGAVPEHYRDRAATIHEQALDLAAAIDDLDTAARLEGGTLELRPGEIALVPLLANVLGDLEPLMRLRGCSVLVAPITDAPRIDGDDRTIERLFRRLLAAIVSAAGANEELVVKVNAAERQIVLVMDRPAALAGIADEGLFSIDAEREAALPGAPLLGTGFALRLARNLANELGGHLALERERLTLRLPAALDDEVEQVSTR